MIIDKKFDRALWLMLKADKNNRDEILEFMDSIPNELIEKIKKNLILFENTDKKKLTFLFGECQRGNRLYWFGIDKYFQEIDMGYKEHNGIVYRDVFEMSLLLDDQILDVDYFDKKDIGRIKYDINVRNIDGVCNVVEASENSYYLMRTLLGYMIMFSIDDNKDTKKYYRMIDINDIPDEINLESLKDMDNVDRLVRRRKK